MSDNLIEKIDKISELVNNMIDEHKKHIVRSNKLLQKIKDDMREIITQQDKEKNKYNIT